MSPALIKYATEYDYRLHYQRFYCDSRVTTFDGLRVYFPRSGFDHAFFESADRRRADKSIFSRERAERIDWIAAALQDGAAELYVGWDNRRRVPLPDRRVTVVYGDYVVVLQLQLAKGSATFITAFVATARALEKIRTSPKWVQKK
jgi:hypothetical protein